MKGLDSLAASGRQRVVAEIRSIFTSRSLQIALLLMLVGFVVWTRREPPTGAAPTTASPALFRLGAGFAGGYLIGFVFRRFVKTTAAVAAVVLGSLALLKATGVLHLDWGAIETHARDSFAWLNGEAGALRTFLTGYLPSAGAGGWGAWKGFRRRTDLPSPV